MSDEAPTKSPEKLNVTLRTRVPQALRSRLKRVTAALSDERGGCEESAVVREALVRFTDAEEKRLGLATESKTNGHAE